MSYILDALKKADAEREQGRVPGLHTHASDIEAELGPITRMPSLWVMGLGVGLVLMAAGAVWLGMRPKGVETATATQPVAPEPAPAPVPAPVPAPMPEPAPAPRVAAAPPRAVQLPAESVTPRKALRTPIHVDPAATSVTSEKVPTLAELPQEVRRTLPTLSVSGAMYSDSPASRMLLINNRVFHEGDQPAAGLVLEEIRLKSAVFRFQGQRFSVNY